MLVTAAAAEVGQSGLSLSGKQQAGLGWAGLSPISLNGLGLLMDWCWLSTSEFTQEKKKIAAVQFLKQRSLWLIVQLY